jgi:ABC-type uncharacterized transport system auxiliary subunit
MRTRLALAFMVMIMSASLIGCIGKVKYPTYYTLNMPPVKDPPTIAAATRASVAVREFRSPAYLRLGAIVYRESPEQIGFYNYQRWAIDPREFVTNAIVDRLRATGKFVTVEVYNGRSNVDFIVSGRLEKLEEVDYGGRLRVRVALTAQMTDLRSGKTVWASDASEIDNVAGRTVPAVVASMSHAMDGAIQNLVTSLEASKTSSP